MAEVRTRIVFNRHFPPYNVGEGAAFLKPRADQLVAQGLAHYDDGKEVPHKRGNLMDQSAEAMNRSIAQPNVTK